MVRRYVRPSRSTGFLVNHVRDPRSIERNHKRHVKHPRTAMKERFLGDLFPASAHAAPGVLFRDFFMADRNGVEKGVVLIDLGSLP